MSQRKSTTLSLGARIIDGVRWRLGRVGIHITAFVTIREDATATKKLPADPAFTFCELVEADTDELIRLEPEYSRERILGWFGHGDRCFGLRDGSRLVAKGWCDLQEVNFPPAHRKLERGEVYMFGAYSDPAYRGRNLAPMLRSACYAELRKRGFTRFYSHSDYFNMAARRFKQKLGAVEEDLKVQVRLSDKWSRTFTVWRYD